jgi:hypothetical protein
VTIISQIMAYALRAMSLGDWFKRLFSSETAEDHADLHEEYGEPDPGEEALEQPGHSRAVGGLPSIAGQEGTEAAEADLAEFEPPPDPAP